MSEMMTKLWDKDRREWVPHVVPNIEEYLRRNLLVCSAIGAGAGVRTIKERLAGQKRIPKWLLDQLNEIETRVDRLPNDLAQWRDVVGYVPKEPQQ